jgi:hypothetical protein
MTVAASSQRMLKGRGGALAGAYVRGMEIASAATSSLVQFGRLTVPQMYRMAYAWPEVERQQPGIRGELIARAAEYDPQLVDAARREAERLTASLDPVIGARAAGALADATVAVGARDLFSGAERALLLAAFHAA